MRVRLLAAGGGLAALVSGIVVALGATGALATNDVELCHLADGPAQAGIIHVAAAAAYNGHYLQHSADVIPPFEFQGETYSLNWTGTYPEECVEQTPTDTTPGTTTDPPGTTTTECPPPSQLGEDGRCDFCPLMEGTQGASIYYAGYLEGDPACEPCPEGTTDNGNGGCSPPEPPDDGDLCPNLDDAQTTVPIGLELAGGLCVEPDKPKAPVDAPPGTEIGDCVVQANREMICGEQG